MVKTGLPNLGGLSKIKSKFHQLKTQKHYYETLIILGITIAWLFAVNPLNAQEKNPQIDVSVDPIAFFLDGVSVHGGYAQSGWHFDLEGFSLEVPSSVHGNESLTAGQLGLELKADYYFKGEIAGPFVSFGGGVSQLTVSSNENDQSKSHFEYSSGLRLGYRWNTGLGNLYLTPLAGLEYTFNGKNLAVGNKTFDSGPLQPYATVNIGWFFPL